MATDPSTIPIYHITAIANLPEIVHRGRLYSDANLATVNHEVIGYNHIKQRRLSQYRVPCHDGRFVGEFVPFYYCYRSPMLYVVNLGRSGKPAGCQKDIVHLVSTVGTAMKLGRPWAISDGNAGAAHSTFSRDINSIHTLDWSAINATNWSGKQHEKQAEFLVADEFPWDAVQQIGCFSEEAVQQVNEILANAPHHPVVARRIGWYYT